MASEPRTSVTAADRWSRFKQRSARKPKSDRAVLIQGWTYARSGAETPNPCGGPVEFLKLVERHAPIRPNVAGWDSSQIDGRRGAHAAPSGSAELQRQFSKSLVASSLWDYGEDAAAARALEMSDDDLAGIQNIAAWYRDPSYSLPLTGQQITNNHVVAFAALTYFEGEVRALSRTRRRAQKAKPPEFQAR